jgi:hypothetical protein
VLSDHDSSAAPQTVQIASPVCGIKNFSSVRPSGRCPLSVPGPAEIMHGRSRLLDGEFEIRPHELLG